MGQCLTAMVPDGGYWIQGDIAIRFHTDDRYASR